MLDLLITLVYIAGIIFTGRIVARAVWNDNLLSSKGSEDLAISLFFGIMAGLLWPIVLPFYGLFMLVKTSPDAILGETKKQKIERLEKEAREREIRIRELERTTGIGT